MFPVIVAITIAAKAASSSESIYNAETEERKKNHLYLKR